MRRAGLWGRDEWVALLIMAALLVLGLLTLHHGTGPPAQSTANVPTVTIQGPNGPVACPVHVVQWSVPPVCVAAATEEP